MLSSVLSLCKAGAGSTSATDLERGATQGKSMVLCPAPQAPAEVLVHGLVDVPAGVTDGECHEAMLAVPA